MADRVYWGGFALLLQTEFGKPGVIVGAGAQGPKKLAVGIFDREVIDASEAPCYEAVAGESPVLVAERAEPVSAVIVPLVGKPDCDPASVKGPQFPDQPIVLLSNPLPCEKANDALTPGKKLCAVPPHAVNRVRGRDLVWIAGVPGVLGKLHPFNRSLLIKRRKRRAGNSTPSWS